MSLFRLKLTRIIIVMPHKYKEIDNVLHTILPIAKMYKDIHEDTIVRLINHKSRYKQTIISLFQDDHINTKILNSTYQLISQHYFRFEDIHPEESALYLKLQKEGLFEDENYTRIQKMMSEFKKKHLQFEAHIPFSDLDQFDVEELHKNLKHTVNFFSYQQIVSFNLSFDYPIVKSKKSKNHFIFAGFGKTNRRILKDFLINDSIPGYESDYTIITNDNLNTKNNFYQDISYYKHKDNHEYLDKPMVDRLFNDLEFKTCDIHKIDFYDMLDEFQFDHSVLTFVISLGSDIMNIQAAHIIIKYLKTRNLINQSKILIKIKDKDMDISKIFDVQKDIIHAFGQYNQVYTYQEIINESYKSFSVDIYHAIRKNEKRSLDDSWQSLPYYDQKSNMYAFLSLRNKLRILGFDLSKNGEPITRDVYFETYDKTQQRDSKKGIIEANDLSVYLEDNMRNKIASYEHERWNAYMIFNGYKPMSVDEFLSRLNDKTYREKVIQQKASMTKDDLLKRHICLTTYEGLKKIGHMIEQINKKYNTQLNFDYYKYDYGMMDHIYEIIDQSSYKIIKMEDDYAD